MLQLKFLLQWGKVASTVCGQLGLERSETHFFLDGTELADAKTVEEQNILDLDEIDMRVDVPLVDEAALLGDDQEEVVDQVESILLKLRSRTGEVVELNVAATATMGAVLNMYAKRTEQDPATFLLRWDGEIVNLDQTVSKLGAEDGDLVDVEKKRNAT